MSKIVPLTGKYRPQAGLKVRTLAPLGNPVWKINWSHTAGKLNNRRENCEGVLTNAVEGYGVDAWWVQHAPGLGLAPYMVYELEAIPVTLGDVINNIFG
jgi:hypothetical protein